MESRTKYKDKIQGELIAVEKNVRSLNFKVNSGYSMFWE